MLVKDIHPGVASSAPIWLTALGSLLMFEVDDGSGGFDPWRSDGTVAGTVKVKDFLRAQWNSISGPFAVVGPHVYSAGQETPGNFEPWRSGAPANAPGILLPGDRAAAVNLWGDCSLYVDPLGALLSALLWTDGGGHSALALPIPLDASLSGGSVAAQMVFGVARPPGFELSFSAGLRLVFHPN